MGIVDLNVLKNIDQKSFFLTTPNKTVISAINDISDKKGVFKFNGCDEISFTITKTENTLVFKDEVIDSTLLYVEDIGYFHIVEPDYSIDENGIETLSVTCMSNEYELSQRKLFSFSINSGTVGSIGSKTTGYVTFYNTENPSLSLLHLALEKYPNWGIGHVDESLVDQQRTFEIDNVSVYDFFTQNCSSTLHCLFIFDTINNLVNVYDLEETEDVSNRNFGLNTHIYITNENLATTINVAPLSTDDIATAVRVRGADGMSIRDVNCGFDYIYDLSYYYPIMSDELVVKWKQYLEDWNDNLEAFSAYMIDANEAYTNLTKTKFTNYPLTTALTTNWDSYSLYYLEIQLDYAEQEVDGYDPSYYDPSVEGYSAEKREIYDNSVSRKEAIEAAIVTRTAQVNNLQAIYDASMVEPNRITNTLTMSNYFTPEELGEIIPLLKEGDYTDENYAVYTNWTVTQITTKKQELRTDAVNAISILSQPQYTISTELDNLFEIDEFQNWWEDFQLGNFFTIIFENGDSILQRLISVEVDDFDDPTSISVEYSNLTKSTLGLSDINYLLNIESLSGATTSSTNFYTGSEDTTLFTEEQKIAIQAMINEALINAGTTEENALNFANSEQILSLLSKRVAKAGDTMTGSLYIDDANLIIGGVNAVPRTLSRSFIQGFDCGTNNEYEHLGCIHSEGYRTRANVDGAHAEGCGGQSDQGGNYNIADGVGSHVEGLDYNIASGNGSHAEGAHYNRASGEGSHVEGYGEIGSGLYGNRATGAGSHAEGYGRTLASGAGSHAEGVGTTANGDGSHAEGQDTSADSFCHAEGVNTYANGYASHAEGRETQTLGITSHAEGNNTSANGYASHTEGKDTLADGSCAHAGGEGTIAASDCQVALGRYNDFDTDGVYSVIIGNGTSANRSNALTVDWDGNVVLSGDVTNVDGDSIGSIVTDLYENYYTKRQVHFAIDAAVSSVYKYKGSVSTYANLPTSGQTVGDVYNVETADSEHGIKAGDNVAWDGAAWDVLAGITDLSAYYTKTETNALLANKQNLLTAGANIQINGTTISATDTTYDNATTSTAGLMSATDKSKLDGIASGAEVNVQSDWSETDATSDAYIANKPALSNVATSGDYNDLSNTPDLSNFIENTDYASSSVAGVIKVGNNLAIDANGVLSSTSAISIDSALSNTSENPVQNAVITGALSNKQDKLTAGTGLSLSGTTINHSNSITAGTAQGDASKTLTFGGTFAVPTVTYDAQGHVTAKGTTTMTMPANPNTDAKVTQTATSTNANYEVLFSATADNTTRTEGARKYSNLKFNPSTGNLQATQLNGVTIGTSPKFTDTNTTYSAGTGLSLSGTTFNHASSITAGTAGTSSPTGGLSLAVPYVTYDATGHITRAGTHTHTIGGVTSTSVTITSDVTSMTDITTIKSALNRVTRFYFYFSAPSISGTFSMAIGMASGTSATTPVLMRAPVFSVSLDGGRNNFYLGQFTAYDTVVAQTYYIVQLTGGIEGTLRIVKEYL